MAASKYTSKTLLGIDTNAKTVKGQSKGFMTGILYLAPAHSAGIKVNGAPVSLCPFASKGCIAGCLNTAGRAGVYPSIPKARIRKTRWLFADRPAFLERLRKDIRGLIRKAERKGLIPAVRVNGTSDQPWLAHQMAGEFPSVQFYDYTKIPEPWKRTKPNYNLTFSLSENNRPAALDALQHGVNVAVVFNTRKGQPLPATWEGFTVIDGDQHDLRFLDARKDSAVVIGLRAKGKAKRDTHGFVQIS